MSEDIITVSKSFFKDIEHIIQTIIRNVDKLDIAAHDAAIAANNARKACYSLHHACKTAYLEKKE